MTIKLSQPFAPNGAVDEFDVRQLKKVLNRLGYYQPFEKIGITGIPDTDIFEALKTFQRDQGLPATGTAKPDDETIKRLNQLSQKEPDGHYIWRTVEDGKVRAAHAQYNRTVRAWRDAPDPGDDFNCRCWAEPVEKNGILSNSAEVRKKAILGHGVADFNLLPNSKASAVAPWHFDPKKSEVSANENYIRRASDLTGVDSDLIRAIIYLETTQGYYDEYTPFDLNKTIRPMNIHAKYWEDLGFTREDLKDPRINIYAGALLLSRIKKQMPKASIAEIATIYNITGAKIITDYGVRIERIYNEKLWKD